jgi:hypothetical protein
MYPSFVAGWNSGGKADKEYSKEIDFQAEAINGIYSYPTPILDAKTGEMIFAEWNFFHVKVMNPSLSPLWNTLTTIFLLTAGLFMLALAIYIPIQVYKVIRSIARNEVFDIKNVGRIRRIGYSLLIYFLISACYNLKSTIEAKSLIHLENYKIVFTLKEEYIFLLFGLIVLLFAEILKISHTIKEENDLTV